VPAGPAAGAVPEVPRTGIIADNWWLFKGHIGGRLLWVNCTYRFETQPFYTGPPMVRLALPSSGAPAPAVETPAAAGGAELLTIFSPLTDRV
jgi:hypothetical protein